MRAILRRATTVAAVALALGACGDLLTVRTSGSLQDAQLDNPALEQFLINGAIGEFQYAYVNYALWSGVLGDEVFTDHPNSGLREVSLHNFDDLNLTNQDVYENLQRARQSADDAVQRVKKMQGTNAGASLNVARALIYGGYSYLLLGEGFCEAPVNLSAGLPPDELFARGIARFDEGIAVATAAKTSPNDGVAQSLIDLARVGAARASLKKGDLAAARAYASPVPATYERWAFYSANSARENDQLQFPTRLVSPFLGMHTVFQGLGDPRAPQPSAARRSLSGNLIYPPLRPSMYSGWSGASPPQTIDVGTSIRFASGLEARYIVVEADGPNAAMLAFVNTRRAVAGKPPVSLSGAALVSEFRTQRALDFYLTGQRLGDLRRYALAGTDLFPTGKFPVTSEIYGTIRCFIVPQSEKVGNPHY